MTASGRPAWTSLSLYESTELVRRFVEERTGCRPGEAKAREIAAHFSQGREYFRSASGAGELVRPLILYYGAVALARGAVLFLDPAKSKLGTSHGLKAPGWPDLLTRPGTLVDSPVRIAAGGTFAELARVTSNTERTRIASQSLPGLADALARGTAMRAGMEISVKDVLGQVPDVSGLYARTFGEHPRRLRCESLVTSLPEPDADGLTRIREVLPNAPTRRQAPLLVFPAGNLGLPDAGWVSEALGGGRLIYQETQDFAFVARDPMLRISRAHSFVLIYDAGSRDDPRVEMPVSATPTGEEYLVLPTDEGVVLSTLLALHLAAYAACTLVRYHPGYWAMLTGRTGSDAVAPVLSAAISAVEERYPALILEALE